MAHDHDHDHDHDHEHEHEHEHDHEAEARRELALAQIRQYPDPVLRLRAREVESFDRDLERLGERMVALMHDAHGVGLAGNQVGVLQRVFTLHLGEDDPIVVVNPRITRFSDEKMTENEGCLSLAGVLVPVERAASVTLEAQHADGSPFTLELEGLGARAAQHETDHLDGALIVDRTDPQSRREAMAILRPKLVLG